MNLMRLVPYLAFLAVPAGLLSAAGVIGPAFPAIRVLEVRSDGRLLAQDRFELILTDAEGRRDPSFVSGLGDSLFGGSGVAATDANGSVFVAGDSYLVKLRHDGSIDTTFRPVRVVNYPNASGGISAVLPDGHGGCYFGGEFNYDISDWDGQIVDPSLWPKVASLAHADARGVVTPLVPDWDLAQQTVFGTQRIVAQGNTLIAAGWGAIWRVHSDGGVTSFFADSTIQWADRGQTFNTAWDPVFGLAVCGQGRTVGMTADWGLCAVYDLDGTLRSSFKQEVWFGGNSAPGGARTLAWDKAGRLLVGNIRDGGVYYPGNPPVEEGMLNPTYSAQPRPGEWESRTVLDGVPPTFLTMKRLLSDGRLDPAWSRALWFESLVYNLEVLPSGDGVAYCEGRVNGFTTPGVVRLCSETQAEQQPQQSVRARLDAAGEPLILGFVITGDSARDVLIRAVGPSLAKFGVSAPAEATRLTLYAGSQRLVSAGWRSDTLPVRRASQRVGAFPLLDGAQPREGQVLVQLPPGAYTVHIEQDGEAASPPAAGRAVLGEVYFP